MALWEKTENSSTIRAVAATRTDLRKAQSSAPSTRREKSSYESATPGTVGLVVTSAMRQASAPTPAATRTGDVKSHAASAGEKAATGRRLTHQTWVPPDTEGRQLGPDIPGFLLTSTEREAILWYPTSLANDEARHGTSEGEDFLKNCAQTSKYWASIHDEVKRLEANDWQIAQEDGWPPPRRTPKYDWDSWLDGKEHLLEQARHFHAEPDSFRTMVIREAKARGMTIEMRIERTPDTKRKIRPRFVCFKASVNEAGERPEIVPE